MKPRFSLSFYPLSGKRLWIILTESNGAGFVNHRTTLDAEETAAFWKY